MNLLTPNNILLNPNHNNLKLLKPQNINNILLINNLKFQNKFQKYLKIILF